MCWRYAWSKRRDMCQEQLDHRADELRPSFRTAPAPARHLAGNDMSSVPMAWSMARPPFTRWVTPFGVCLQAATLVFLVALNDIATAGRRGTVALALQVAIDAVARDGNAPAVAKDLNVTFDVIAAQP